MMDVIDAAVWLILRVIEQKSGSYILHDRPASISKPKFQPTNGTAICSHQMRTPSIDCSRKPQPMS